MGIQKSHNTQYTQHGNKTNEWKKNKNNKKNIKGNEIQTEQKRNESQLTTIFFLFISLMLELTYRWSWRLNAFEHMLQTYFLSSLCVSLCFAKADALPNTLLQTYLNEFRRVQKQSIQSSIINITIINNDKTIRENKMLLLSWKLGQIDESYLTLLWSMSSRWWSFRPWFFHNGRILYRLDILNSGCAIFSFWLLCSIQVS